MTRNRCAQADQRDGNRKKWQHKPDEGEARGEEDRPAGGLRLGAQVSDESDSEDIFEHSYYGVCL